MLHYGLERAVSWSSFVFTLEFELDKSMNLRLLQRLQRWSRSLLATALAFSLSACVFAPGGHIGYSEKGSRLKDIVDVRPITRELVRSLEPSSSRQRALGSPGDPRFATPLHYDYLIGRGDILSIIVYDHPELTIPAGGERSASESGNVVHSDGTIFYPYIGQVDVAGRTVREIRAEIQERLARFIAQPQVDVKVVEFNAQKAYVTGQVGRPGTLAITNVPMRVLDALSAAGGLSGTANWHEVVLTRDGRDMPLSVYDMLTNGELEQNLLLRDGDVLHVPEVGNQQVYVMGEVNNPMALPLGNDRLSLTNALSRAGGIREVTANASGIFVIRRNPETSKKFATVYQLDAGNAVAFVLGTEFMLQPTDVVYVTAAPVSRWNRVLTQLLPSLTTLYQISEIGETFDTVTRK